MPSRNSVVLTTEAGVVPKTEAAIPVEAVEVKELATGEKGKAKIGPVVILVLDGMGFNPRTLGNAVITAGEQHGTKNLQSLLDRFGCVLTRTDGETEGLRPGVFGNSEAGHSTLRGIGEPETLVGVDHAIADGSLRNSETLNAAIGNCLKNKSALHFMGLCSDVGVHGDINHMYEMLRYAKERGVGEAYLHFVTDGRDASERGSLRYRVDGMLKGQKTPAIMREAIDDFMGGRLDEVLGRNDGYSRLMADFLSCLKEAGYVGADNKLVYPEMRVEDVRELVDSGEVEIPGYLLQAEAVMAKVGFGRIATVGGRHYYMDRNNNWDRTRKAYDAMTQGAGAKTESPAEALKVIYGKGIHDQEIPVHVVVDEKGSPVGIVKDKDSFVMFNTRADRALQIVAALARDDFRGFDRRKLDIYFACMTEYDEKFRLPIIFKPSVNPNGLGRLAGEHGLRQLKISSTEKFTHVTFFVNGKKWEPNPNEERVLVPDPHVGEYHQKPQMSTKLVAAMAADEIRSGKYDLVIVNFPNCDMVGHTGRESAVVDGIKTVDEGVGMIWNAVERMKGVLIVTADHGNGDMNINPRTGVAHAEHTTSPAITIIAVPGRVGRFVCDAGRMRGDPERITIADIAPTVCGMLGLPVQEYMTGRPLGNLVVEVKHRRRM